MTENIYTVSKEEAMEIAQHFKTTDKGAYATRYVDLPNAIEVMRKWREKKGLGSKVEITLKREVKLRKQATYQKVFRTMTCPFTKLVYGKFRGINPATQLPQWAAMELIEYRSFNLADDNDAADWLIIRLAPYIEGSVNMDRANVCYWEFHDPRASNTNTILRARDYVKVVEYVDSLSGSELVNACRMMNMQMLPGDENTLAINDLQGFLLSVAESDPAGMLAKLNTPGRNLFETFHAAQAIGMITHSFTDGYMALGNSLGRSVEDVITILRQDKNLYGIIKGEVNRNDLLAHRMEEKKPIKGFTAGQKEIITSSVIAEPDTPENIYIPNENNVV